jgi:hypothetical protein
VEPADRESIFWIPSLQPEAVQLSAASVARASATAPIDLAHLPGLDLRRADDGWHGVWRAGGTVHQFWLAEGPSDTVAAYIASLPFDDLLELRAHAARRFRRALDGRPPGRPYRVMPDQLRQLHILTLRALDARQRGESYRTIAEVLLGFHGTKTDWVTRARTRHAVSLHRASA